MSSLQRGALSPAATNVHGADEPGAERFDFDPNTVGGAIALALRKELLHLWACEDPNSLNVDLLDVIVVQVAPSLIHGFIELAYAQVPGLTVEATTRLPEASARAAGATFGTAASATAHAELLEELQGYLGSVDLLGNRPDARNFLHQEVAPHLPASHSWQCWLSGDCALLLPADAVLGICMVAGPVLLSAHMAEEDHLEEDSQQRGEAETSSVDIAGGSGGGALYDKDSLPAGAPQGLARAMRCRRRVFALERELVARERAEKEREAFSKAERERAEARLMEVNHQLEERLKARTEELKRAGQKIIEAQRNVDDARSQLAERKREIAQLKYQLDQDNEIRREAQLREQEHSRSLLRAAARASLAKENSKKRAELLKKCIAGGTEAISEILMQPDIEELQTDVMIDQMEADFPARIQHRKEQYDALLDEFQRQIEKKRQEYNEINKRLKETNASYYSVTGTMGHMA